MKGAVHAACRSVLRLATGIPLVAVCAGALGDGTSTIMSEVEERGEPRGPLPAAAEIALLPPDGGPDFNRLIFEQSPYLLMTPNAIWLSDITYIPTEEGWLYLAGHKDIFTGEIVGYAMSSRITKTLVSQSLFRAVVAKRPGSGLNHHSGRGRQYCAPEYRKLVDQLRMRVSMSRKGDCYDNAPMESFWGTLKNELVHHSRYKTREQAIREITEHIEVFYNRQRRQARLGYLSPAVYERQFYARQAAA